jgi:hypothetical protein
MGMGAQTINRIRQRAERNILGSCMEIGETVVLVRDIEGIETGRHGRVMGLCDDTVMVGCRMRERLHVVLVHTWYVLPEPMWRPLLRRRAMAER